MFVLLRKQAFYLQLLLFLVSHRGRPCCGRKTRHQIFNIVHYPLLPEVYCSSTVSPQLRYVLFSALANFLLKYTMRLLSITVVATKTYERVIPLNAFRRHFNNRPTGGGSAGLFTRLKAITVGITYGVTTDRGGALK